MRTTILAVGSRGDVQPYIALGLGLRKAGHDVTVATMRDFVGFVESYGLACRGSQYSFGEILRGRRGVMLDEAWRMCRDAEILLFSPLGRLAAPHIAEKLGIPAIDAPLQPSLAPTREFASLQFARRSRGGAYNYLTHILADQLSWMAVRPWVNRFRTRTLGLPRLGLRRPAREPGVPVLHAYSETVRPKPEDWDEQHHVTGFWFLPAREDWRPEPELQAFLDAGSPPVYVGFGTMANRTARESAEIVSTALARTGLRAIYAPGPNTPEDLELPDHVLRIAGAPYDWLFPRTSAVVHHGGAGTTSTGLRAGRPTAVVPFFFDQILWGQRTYELGAGPRPIRRARLTADNLTGLLREVTESEPMRRKAAEIGERLRSEDGVGRAVSVFDQFAGVVRSARSA